MNFEIKKSTIIVALKCCPLFLMVIYLGGAFSPVTEVKGILTSGNLDNALLYQSGSNIGKQIFWVSMFFFTIFNYLNFSSVKIKNSISMWCFISFILLCIVSVLWTDYSGILLKRVALQIVLITSIALSISILKTKEMILDVLYYSFAFLALYNLLFIVIFPHYSFDPSNALSGIYKAKNYLGFVALSALILTVEKYSLCRSIKQKVWPGIFCIIWTAFLVLSLSKTCIFVGLIFVFFWCFRFIKNLDRFFVNTFFYCLVTFYLLFPLFSYALSGSVFDYFLELFHTVDLTGRGEIWKLAIDSVHNQKFLGVGYGSFWGVGEIPLSFDVEFRYLKYLNQAHNGYLDILIQLGFVGLSLLFIFLFSFITFQYKELSMSFRYLVIFVLIHNITESSLFRDTHFVWFLFLIIIISSWFKLEKRRV